MTHVLIDTGHGVPIGKKGEKWSQLRESYDLNPLPPTTHSHPKAVKEIQTLVKSLEFDKLVEYVPPEKRPKPKPAETKKKPEKKDAKLARRGRKPKK